MSHQESLVRAHLGVPKAAQAHFKRNFIRQAVCELRFPTLFELEASKPPSSFAHALRKEYPNHTLLESVTMGPTTSRSNVHSFKSRQQQWTVNLSASSVVLETSRYDSFAEFKSRLAAIVAATAPIIDCDFFTRVGLRYINLLPYLRVEIREWVNPSLVGPLSEGIYGDVSEHNGRVGGTIPTGAFLMQHGIATGAVGEGSLAYYSLDFDFSSEDVSLDKTIEMVQELHDQEFSLFQWALGPKAKAFLGESDIRERK